MQFEQKLRVLAAAAKYDASCASSGSRRERTEGGLGNGASCGICHSYTPDGRCVSLLKILLTNYCIYDCAYCVNRVTNDIPRARFTPAEVVYLTMEFYRRNYIEGLFLSSGIIQSIDYTMEQMTAAVRSLRLDHGFCGYIHLKAVPGSSRELLLEAGRWADRVSANIELPTQRELDRLAPAKTHEQVESSMAALQHGILDARDRSGRAGTPRFAPAGQSTQMIVGASPGTDFEILSKAWSLYSAYDLRRVYYSAFSPIPGAHPLLPTAAPPLVRENRLYQADWLLRFYGFSVEELATPVAPDLPLDRDPKLDWALRNREFFPIDVNRAARPMLLRVPGLGVRTVDRILKVRRYRAIRFADLAKLQVPLTKARPFVITADRNPAAHLIDSAPARQLDLFATS